MAATENNTVPLAENSLAAGTVIAPSAATPAATTPTAEPVAAAKPVPTPAPSPAPLATVLAPAPVPEPAAAIASAPVDPVAPAPSPSPEPPSVPPSAPSEQAALGAIQEPESFANKADEQSPDVAWTASEFIHHDKSAGWYIALSGAAAVIAVVVYLITNDLVSVAVVAVAAIILGIYGRHQPQQIDYRLDQSGLHVGQKKRTYDEFKSFSVVPEGAFSSVVLLPLKRFGVLTTIYFAPEDEDQIVDVLSDHLPYEERSLDAVDKLMRRIRF